MKFWCLVTLDFGMFWLRFFPNQDGSIIDQKSIKIGFPSALTWGSPCQWTNESIFVVPLCHTYLLTILTIWDSFLLPLRINISGPIMHDAYSTYAYFDVGIPHARNQLKETDRAQVHMWINISCPIMPYLLTYHIYHMGFVPSTTKNQYFWSH